MRLAAAIVAAGLGGMAVRRLAALRMSMRAAAPELRTWAVLVTAIPMNTLTLPVIRLLMSFRSSPGPGVTVTEHRVGDAATQVLVLTPDDRPVPRPAVLWLHGGGMCAGTAQLEVEPAARVIRETDAVVVSPNYRLAPENPFPAGLDDCMATLQWMVKHSDELGIDPARIATCGTSAGGGLAAAVAQRALDQGIQLRAQVLTSPMLDDRTALRNDLAGKGELTWSPQSNFWAWTAYLGRPPRLTDAPNYASPARRADLAGLPAAWIGFGDIEIFHDECIDYAQRLQAAGVPCEVVTVPGMYHTAEGIVRDALPIRSFHAGMVEFLRRYLDSPPKSA